MSGFASKRIEFDTVKIRIVELFPQSHILNRIDSAHPILYNKSRVFGIFVFCNIRKREIIVFVDMDFLIQYGNFFVLHSPVILFDYLYLIITYLDRLIKRKQTI